MIIGLGQDLVDIRRIEKALAQFGPRFEKRCFTDSEQVFARGREKAGLMAATYAKRYAAKEACAKALGTGLWRGVRFTDIQIGNQKTGAPYIILKNRAQEALNRLTPQGKTAQIHLSLTDEPPYAQALVIIEI